MLWKKVEKGDLLLDRRTDQIYLVKASRSRRGTFLKGGWVREVTFLNLSTGEEHTWPHGNSADIMPYAYLGR